MDLFLDIDRVRSVFRLLFLCSIDSAGFEAESQSFDDDLFQVTDGVQVPKEALEKLKLLHTGLASEAPTISALASEVVRDFENEKDLLGSVLRIVLRISNDEGMLCARDRERVRDVARQFSLGTEAYELFTDFEQGMLISCFRDNPLDDPLEDLAEHFETLECSPEMTAEEVRRKYRSLAMEHHPDRSKVRGENGGTGQKFQKIQEAYQAIRVALSA